MAKEKYFQFVASFMIVLVMTLPFYASEVYAGIEKITIKGTDGIEGFARSQDTLEFSVEATTANGTLTKDQIYVGNTKFDKCASSQSGASTCTLKYPASGKQQFESKPVPFAIYLYKDSSKQQLEDSMSGTVLIDSIAPSLQLSVQKNTFSGQENIELNYQASDLSCIDPACASQCAGLKSIEFSGGNGSFKQAVSPNLTGCSASGSISIDSKKLKNGLNAITAKAFDKFSQQSQEIRLEVTVDSVAPEILASTFSLTTRGIALNSYSPFSVPVEISIDINAADLEVNSVIADFTPLNPAVKNLKGSCSPLNSETHRCRWSIDLNPGIAPTTSSTTPSTTSSSPAPAATSPAPSGSATSSTPPPPSSPVTGAATAEAASSKNIVINASDINGNKASATLTKSLTLDDKGPIAQSITAGIPKDGKLFAKSAGNLVTVILSESTLLSAAEVFLHVGSNRIPASSCKKESNWVCKWENVNFGTADKVILAIKSDTVDILKNPSPEEKTLEIIIDDAAPVVTGISFTPVGSLSASFPDMFKVEDKIAVEANITEKNDLIGSADFSNFIKDAKKIAGECKRLEEDKQQCKWLSEPITKDGTNIIKFNFSDPAGNELIDSRQLNVLGLDISIPDYWKNTVESSPQRIDRQLGTLISQRAYCRIKLEPKSQNPSILVLTPASLSSCKSTQPIIQDVETFNNERGSTEPFVKITLKKDPLEINEVKLTCAFGIVSRVGDRVTKLAENEEAEITLKFYNFPLGKFDDGVQKKIDEAKKDARESLKIVGSLNKIMAYARKICQVFGLIYNVVVIYTTVTVAKKVIAEAMKLNPLTAGPSVAVDAAAEGTCYGQQSAEDIAGKSWVTTGGPFCKFVNCQWAPGIIGDYQEWITSQINKLPYAQKLPGPGLGSDVKIPQIGVTERDIQKSKDESDAEQVGSKKDEKKTEPRVIRTQLAGYMDPQSNFLTGMLFACVPGIIAGLDKYRQIKCLYADCLENAVAKDGLSPSVCEEMKNFATCKYLYGEVFALIPYAAVFDHFTTIIKDSLSNPFSGISIGLSLTVGSACKHTCPARGLGSSAFYITCEVIKITSKTGEVLQNVQGLYKEGFKIREDYCSRLEQEEDKDAEEGEETEDNSQTSQSNTKTQSNQQNTQSQNSGNG